MNTNCDIAIWHFLKYVISLLGKHCRGAKPSSQSVLIDYTNIPKIKIFKGEFSLSSHNTAHEIHPICAQNYSRGGVGHCHLSFHPYIHAQIQYTAYNCLPKGRHSEGSHEIHLIIRKRLDVNCIKIHSIILSVTFHGLRNFPPLIHIPLHPFVTFQNPMSHYFLSLSHS